MVVIIKFIQKLIILWEKNKQKTLVEIEMEFINKNFKQFLEIPETFLRERLSELQKLKKRNKDENKEFDEINSKINAFNHYSNMLEKGKQTKKELEDLIKTIKLFS